ncbi:NUT family member 2A [Plecturocebus cupreus]
MPPNSLDPLNQAEDPDIDHQTNTGVLRKCPKLCLGSVAPAEIHQEWEKCPRGKEHGLRGTKVDLLTKNGSQGDIRLRLCAAHAVCVAAIQLEMSLSSCLLAGALHRMAPTPTKCLGSYVLNLFVFKFYWIYLNSGESVEAGHSLGPVLDFSYHGNCQTAVISTQPKGMASNEGESIGTGALSNSLPCFKSLGIQI